MTRLGIGGVLCSQKKIFEPHFDEFQDEYIAFNMKISRLNQMLLWSQLKSFNNSFDFKDYYSLPLNIKAYEILNSKGLISNK